MAAERRAKWDQETWAAPPDVAVKTAPSQMMLLALKSQAAALIEATELDPDDILEGVMIHQAARRARPDWYAEHLQDRAEQMERAAEAQRRGQ